MELLRFDGAGILVLGILLGCRRVPDKGLVFLASSLLPSFRFIFSVPSPILFWIFYNKTFFKRFYDLGIYFDKGNNQWRIKGGR